MARKKTTAGGFYSYISHGLGRELGIGTGYGAVVAYSVFEASLAGGFAYFANLKLAAFGINIGWPWLALGMVVLISLLTFFDVRLSSTLLAIGLISEVAILVIFDVFMFAHGPRARGSAINPAKAFKSFPPSGKLAAGAVGIGLFFAFWSWVGFEMAPNYGEESRDPKRIVPRALYISVIGLGVFYTLTSWAPLFGYSSPHAAIAAAQGNAANFYLDPARQLRRPLGRLDHELPDHHRVVRLRHGVPQHHRPVHVLARPGGPAARARSAGRTRSSRARTSPRSCSRSSPR